MVKWMGTVLKHFAHNVASEPTSTICYCSASYICVNVSFILTVVVNIVMYCCNHDTSYISCTLQQALSHDFFFMFC